MAKNKVVYLADTENKTIEMFTFASSMCEFDINKVFMNMTGNKYFKVFIKRYRVLEQIPSKYRRYREIEKDKPLKD